jgi:hypothetical protein
MVFLGHLTCRNYVQTPETKSRSNIWSWEICCACGGRGEGRYLNEKGQIWNLNCFRHTLCWREGGSLQLWRSVDVLIIVATIIPWSSCQPSRGNKKSKSKDLSLKFKTTTTLTERLTKRQRQSFQGQKMSTANSNKKVALQTPKQSHNRKQQQQKSSATTTSARLCFTIWFPLQHQREKIRNRTCLKTQENHKRKKKPWSWSAPIKISLFFSFLLSFILFLLLLPLSRQQ